MKIVQRTCFVIATLCPVWFVGSIHLMFYLSGTNQPSNLLEALGMWGFLLAGPLGFVAALLFLLTSSKKTITVASTLAVLTGIGLALLNLCISGLTLMRFIQTLEM